VFVLRRDHALVRRIATLLGWKDMRRKAKADPAVAATAATAVKPEDGAPTAADLGPHARAPLFKHAVPPSRPIRCVRERARGSRARQGSARWV
jgi:hypothetical protein